MCADNVLRAHLKASRSYCMITAIAVLTLSILDPFKCAGPPYRSGQKLKAVNTCKKSNYHIFCGVQRLHVSVYKSLLLDNLKINLLFIFSGGQSLYFLKLGNAFLPQKPIFGQ